MKYFCGDVRARTVNGDIIREGMYRGVGLRGNDITQMVKERIDVQGKEGGAETAPLA